MEIGMTFGTHHSQITVGLRIAFYLPKPPIFDISKYATTVPAPVAKSRDPCDRSLRACMSPLLKVKEFMTQGKGPYGSSGYFEKSPPR